MIETESRARGPSQDRKGTKAMTNAAIRALRHLHECPTICQVAPKTAREFELDPETADHELSQDGAGAIMPNGDRWIWNSKFEQWQRWM